MKNKIDENLEIVIFSSISHLFVDMSTIYVTLNCIKNFDNMLLYIMIYNMFAFCLQLPIGLLTDYFKITKKIIFLSFLFIIFGTFFDNAVFSILFVSIGNAMYHVGCGKEILERSKGKCGFSGIYVSTGAIGVFLSRILINKNINFIIIIRMIILILIFILYIIKNNFGFIENNNKNYEKNFIKMAYLIFLLMITIFIRSLFSNFDIKFNSLFSIIMMLFTFLGKATGGIIADIFGKKITILISLILATICFLFYNNPYFIIFGVFLFNMSMPITLILVSDILNNYKGMAFGITTCMLFIGSINLYINRITLLNKSLFILPAVQFVLMFLVFKEKIFKRR